MAKGAGFGADNILIYGVSKQAQTLYKLITMEQKADILAFIVDARFKKADELLGLPIIEIDEAFRTYSQEDVKICLGFGYKNMVHNREEKFRYCKRKGYAIYTYVSDKCINYCETIGEGSIIYPGTILQPFTSIGEGSFIEAGCVIAHHTQIGDYNFIAPGVHFCGSVKTGRNCFFGGAAEIINDVTIGNEVFVSAGAKVGKDLQDRVAVKSSHCEVSGNDSFTTMGRMFR